MKYMYDILLGVGNPDTGAGVQWRLASDTTPHYFQGNDLLLVLNHLGDDGWEVSGTGTFSAKTPGREPVAIEILLKKAVPTE